MSWSPSQTLTIGESYLNGRGEVMGPVINNSGSTDTLAKYPFRIVDHAPGPLVFTRKGKISQGNQSLDDLILSTEGATKRKIVPSEYYHAMNGDVRGPIIKAKPTIYDANQFPFYYVKADYGKVRLTEDGKAENPSLCRNLDLTRKGSGPDAPEPETGYESQSSNNAGDWTTPQFPSAFTNKKPKKFVPQPKAIKLPAPRRRMITINSVRNTIAPEPEAPKGPKWKRLSVYENANVILHLAEVQHIEKQFSTGVEGRKTVPNGLNVITGKTTYAFDQDTWMNPVYIGEDDKLDFLTQFDAYLTFLETPIVITKEAKPKKKLTGVEIGQASGILFKTVEANIPEDIDTMWDDDDMPF